MPAVSGNFKTKIGALGTKVAGKAVKVADYVRLNKGPLAVTAFVGLTTGVAIQKKLNVVG
jgi:hypothetical protein